MKLGALMVKFGVGGIRWNTREGISSKDKDEIFFALDGKEKKGKGEKS